MERSPETHPQTSSRIFSYEGITPIGRHVFSVGSSLNLKRMSSISEPCLQQNLGLKNFGFPFQIITFAGYFSRFYWDISWTLAQKLKRIVMFSHQYSIIDT